MRTVIFVSGMMILTAINPELFSNLTGTIIILVCLVMWDLGELFTKDKK